MERRRTLKAGRIELSLARFVDLGTGLRNFLGVSETTIRWAPVGRKKRSAAPNQVPA